MNKVNKGEVALKKNIIKKRKFYESSRNFINKVY